MNEQEKAFFEALSIDRAQLADALDKPALRGVKHSVVEKYSDQAHFVYELLQNADDAKATTARFVLHNDRLIFAHNGTRRFSVSDPATEDVDSINDNLGDINAITSIANSNKRESSIGKFGVGFKAVFQYTSTPHIYDPNVFFKIDRFIVPSFIEFDYPERKQGETLFLFPFDHAERNEEEAFEDISEKLRSLDYPLLFLSSLQDITFEILDGKDIGIYEKKTMQCEMFGDTIAELICHTQIEDNDLPDRKLWLFTRKTETGLSYSVGFFIDDNGNLIPKKHTAFCFFPTKEETWLNFIFHAPFLLTDSRENIKAGVPHNKKMIDLLAELAADSLLFLKDIGQANNQQLITDDIFGIIPFDETVFGDLNDRKKVSFKQFYVAIKEKMESEVLIPTHNGYVSKKNAYWAEYSPTTGIFSDEQLSELVGNDNAKWAFPSLSRGNYARDKNNPLLKYIDSIINEQITEDKIIGRIAEEFIEAQEVDWLHKFYKWVSETKGRTDMIRTRPIFLNQNREAVSAYEKLGKNEHIVL